MMFHLKFQTICLVSVTNVEIDLSIKISNRPSVVNKNFQIKHDFSGNISSHLPVVSNNADIESCSAINIP